MKQEKRCSVEGCNGKHKARGYCDKHYRRILNTGTLKTKRDVTTWKKAGINCEYEGCKKKSVIAGLCSNHYKQKQRYGKPGRTVFDNSGECSVDGCEAKAHVKGMCRIHYYRVKHNGDPHKLIKGHNTGFCSVCNEKKAKKKGMCDGCYAKWAYQNVESYRESRNNTQRKRRASKRGLESEHYTKQEVLEKTSGKCSICGKEINSSIKFPDPYSFTFEHVVPLSKGGSNKLINVMPAHYLCNVRKGNKV